MSKLPLIVFLLSLLSLIAFCGSVSALNRSDATLLSKYKPALDLLEHAFHIHEFSPENIFQIENTKSQIRNLSIHLVGQERTLHQLNLQLSQAKKNWYWFFDLDSRKNVDIIQIKINDHIRHMEGTIDEINFQWKQLKPLYGVYSKMFMGEMFGFIPLSVDIVKSLVQLLIIFDVLTLVLFGPVAVVFLLFFLSLGLNFIFSILSMIVFGAAAYWVFYLPFVVIQYDPTFFEFLSVYIPFLGVFFCICAAVFGLFRRSANN
eukprot:TRINITY_DN8075_c0_g1_i1.p1 TRINITY_DN8075_c0_g1~~TRINITY_DN8075_c0_g1_i1.p1  ORF type:complete len:261 (-),score=71.59 TRINITY_DN8075_c0_g1_i1:80-862(-)